MKWIPVRSIRGDVWQLGGVAVVLSLAVLACAFGIRSMQGTFVWVGCAVLYAVILVRIWRYPESLYSFLCGLIGGAAYAGPLIIAVIWDHGGLGRGFGWMGTLLLVYTVSSVGLGFSWIALMTLFVIRFWRRVPSSPRHRRIVANSCRRCGYYLRGLDRSRCPECGEPFVF